jgi:hypothetical protein
VSSLNRNPESRALRPGKSTVKADKRTKETQNIAASKIPKYDNENQQTMMKTNPLHLAERRNSRKGRTNGKQENR